MPIVDNNLLPRNIVFGGVSITDPIRGIIESTVLETILILAPFSLCFGAKYSERRDQSSVSDRGARRRREIFDISYEKSPFLAQNLRKSHNFASTLDF